MNIVDFDPRNPNTWPYVLTFNKHLTPITGFSKPKLLDMAAHGEIPARKVRGRWVVPKDLFLEWLNAI
ncbi:MAG: helix-turn-helix domain-containing protein [Syntrophomonas sp.]